MTKPRNSTPVRIDFVSDVSCPWCVVGLRSLERALARLGDDIAFELHLQPFELNPQMPAEGQDAVEHLTRKYDITPQQAEQNGEGIRARGAELGFTFDLAKRRRVYNTFDAHRLLHWAGLQGEGRDIVLKHALLRAYFSDGQDVSDHPTLARLAGEAGLDAERALTVLASGEFSGEVRAQEAFYAARGISAVPSVILNERHLIQGGQPPEVFERALRQLLAQPD